MSGSRHLFLALTFCLTGRIIIKVFFPMYLLIRVFFAFICLKLSDYILGASLERVAVLRGHDELGRDVSAVVSF